MLTEVKLYGDLVDFGESWELDVHTPAEALQAIDTNCHGFLDKIQDGSKYSFVLTRRGQNLADDDVEIETLDLERLELPMSNTQTLHIIPVASGDLETVFFVAVSALVDIGVPTVLASIIVAAAIVVVLVGVSRLLMPAPPGMDTSQEGEESYYFNGPVNTSRQGACVPVLYGGPLLVGSQVIGQSLIAEDVAGFENSQVLKSKAYAEVVDAISEGPIEGFAGADLESSVYLDGTPFKAGGEDLFEGFSVDFTEGTLDQDFKNLTSTTNTGSTSVNNVGLWVRQATGGIIKTTNNPNVDQIKITVNTGRFTYIEKDGDVKPLSVTLLFSIKGNGRPSFYSVQQLSITGVASSSYYRTYSFDLDDGLWGPPPYTMKLERLTADREGDPQVSDQVYWTSWTEVVKSNCSFPLTAYAVTKYDAEKFSAVPTRGYLLKGLLVKVPSNYDPVTRTYDGAWDGTFKANTEFTNNPAWVFYDLATNPRYGLGKYLSTDLIDKWALYSIAQYCDQLVDDGFSGTEPRFTCNLYLQTKKEAFSVLKELASAFRSIQFWVEGQLRLHQDAPGTIHAVFAPANVVDGIFTYSGTPKHTRFTAALVTWINPEDNYSSWVEYVEDEAGIQLYGLNETSITAVGCTSRGQARRTGKYALLTSRLETDVVSFKGGMSATSCSPGKIIKVVDPLHNQSNESVAGRLTGIGSATSVALDRPVTLEAGHTYHISFTLPDGSRSAHQITNGAGTVTPPSAITFAVALTQTPVDGAMWDITDDAESERLYRVLSLIEAKGNSPEFYELSAIRYDAETLSQADDPGKLEPPDQPPINPGLSSPSGLALTEGVLPVGTSFRRYIDITWLAPSTGVIDRYQVEIIDPSANTTKVTVNATEYRAYDVVAGVYTVTVRAINVAGQLSAGVSVTTTLDDIAPIDLISITGLELKGQGLDTNFTGPDAEFAWRLTSALTGEMGDETFGGDTGIPDPWFRDYEVTVYDDAGEILRRDYTYDRGYFYTLGKNLEDGGPRRTFEVGVAARDIFNRTTDQEFLEVSNPPPVDYTNISIATGIEQIVISFDAPPDPDFVGTRVYVSQETGFTPNASNLMYDGRDLTISIGNLPEEYYYVRLEGRDEFGPAGVYTAEFEVHITSVERIHSQIAGEIQQGWLYKDLSDKIDLTQENSDHINILATEVSYKTTTYRQSSQPNSPNTGDTWYRTDQNNQPYRYNGATGLWESVQDTTSTGTTSYVGSGVPADDPVTYSTGDVYYDSADTFHPYRFDGAVWVSVRDTTATGVKTYYSPSEPATGMAEGDLWFDTDDANKIHRYTSGVWVPVTDDTAGNSTYFGVNIPPNNPLTYKDGDLFFDEDDGNRPYRFNGAVWEDIRDNTQGNTTYVDAGTPSPGDPYIRGDLYFDSANANYPYWYDGAAWVEIPDGSSTGISSWYQDDAPTVGMSIGDLWFDTNSNNKVYRYNGSVDGWVPVTDESVVGGVTPYIQPNQPAAPGLVPGDLWIDTDDNDKAYEWDGDSWNELNETNITMTAATAVERMDRVSADNIGYAEYTIKVDVNGHIAGIGLGVSGGVSGPIRSEIIMLADKFAIGLPTDEWQPNHVYEVGQWVTPTQSWIDVYGYPQVQPDGETLYRWDYVYEVTSVTGSATTSPIESSWWTTPDVSNWNGSVEFTVRPAAATIPFVAGMIPQDPHTDFGDETLVPGVIISNAAIGHLSVDTAHIANLSVTDGKITTLTVEKLTSGTIDVEDYIYLGDYHFRLDSAYRRLTVEYGTIDRVELGGLSTGGYGIIIRDGANNVMLQSGGLSEINGTFIANASIGSAAIEDSLHSAGWSGPGGAGFELKVNGSGAGSAIFNELSIYNDTGDLLVHAGSSVGDFRDQAGGANMVFNSQMYPRESGWGYYEPGVANPTDWFWEDRTDQWSIHPGVLSLAQLGDDQAGYSYALSIDYIAIEGTKRYQFGGRTGAHRCSGYVGVQFYDADKNYISSLNSATNNNAKQGGREISDYFDHSRFIETAEIPSGAAYVRLAFVKLPTNPGEANSYLFCTRAQFCEAKPNQIDFTPYSPGFESIGANNPITSANADLVVSTAAIKGAHIESLSVDKLDGDIVDAAGAQVEAGLRAPDFVGTGGDFWTPWHTTFSIDVAPSDYDRSLFADPFELRGKLNRNSGDILVGPNDLYLAARLTRNGVVIATIVEYVGVLVDLGSVTGASYEFSFTWSINNAWVPISGSTTRFNIDLQMFVNTSGGGTATLQTGVGQSSVLAMATLRNDPTITFVSVGP